MDGLFLRDIVSFLFLCWAIFLLTAVFKSCELWPEVFLGSLGLNLFQWGTQALCCKNAFMKGLLLKFWNGGEYISADMRYKMIVKMILHNVFVAFTVSRMGSFMSQEKRKSYPNDRSAKSVSIDSQANTCFLMIHCVCNLIKIFVLVDFEKKHIMFIFLYVSSESSRFAFLQKKKWVWEIERVVCWLRLKFTLLTGLTFYLLRVGVHDVPCKRILIHETHIEHHDC